MRAVLGRFLGKTPQERVAVSPKLAVAELLLEMTRADYAADAAEVATVRELLRRAYELADDELDALLQEAGDHLRRSVSLYDTVASLKDALSQEERQKLIGMLWRVAYADGKLDKYEEALLRKLCDLLYVPHSAFIREKLAAAGEPPGDQSPR
jgi:uncharacterized tellurite resistance protein B-like protein